MRPFQFDIFNLPEAPYNLAIKQILALKPEKAREILAQWEKDHSCIRDLSFEWRLIEFLEYGSVSEALEKDPEKAFYLWNQQHDLSHVSVDKGSRKLVHLFRKAYFNRVSQTIRREGIQRDKQFYLDGRAIKCLLFAEKWEVAEALSRTLLELSQFKGRLLGYLADSLFAQGKAKEARAAYLKALWSWPEQVDIKGIQDGWVRRLCLDPESVCEEWDLPHGPWFNKIEWSASIGLLTGIFDPEAGLDCEGLKGLWLQLKKIKEKTSYHQGGSDIQGHKARIFAIGIILSSNGDMLTQCGLDLVEIRRLMKCASPQLFVFFMKRFLSV